MLWPDMTARLILGIDEAGRGPVIGPLVFAGVLIGESQEDSISQLGVRDSKQLSRARREALAPEITAVALDTRLLAIPAQQLGGNLTQIELDSMTQLIRELKPDVVYLDVPVPPTGITHYVSALGARVGNDEREIIAENKADEKYPIVSAASILAKVHRDRQIEQLKAEYGDFGWGYPSERKTRQFLENWYATHGAFPACVRQRWKTVQRLIQKRRSYYEVDETLWAAVRQLSAASEGSSEQLDRVIQQLGAHHVAHLLVTTANPSLAEALRLYLSKHWPAHWELIERLIRAACRSPENEDLQGDFGQS